MTSGRSWRARVPLSAQPYRLSWKAPVVVYQLVVVMIVATVLVTVLQARFSWLWIVPYLATAAAVHGYRRERAAKNMKQGTLWAFAEIGAAIAAYAAIALPAKY